MYIANRNDILYIEFYGSARYIKLKLPTDASKSFRYSFGIVLFQL